MMIGLVTPERWLNLMQPHHIILFQHLREELHMPEKIPFLFNLIKFNKKSSMCSENINFSWSSPNDDLKIAFYVIFDADFDFQHQRY